MTRGLQASLPAYLLAPGMALAGPVAEVTSGNDSGEGTLRDALTSGARVIRVDPGVSVIDLESALYYTGDAALIIRGTGQTIDGFGLGEEPILTIVDGADLAISGLTFDAGGGNEYGPYERIENEGGGSAIYVDVRNDATGTVTVDLKDIVVRGTGNHGIHISYCVPEGGDSDSCGDGIVDVVISGSMLADTLEIESYDGDAGSIDAFVRARGSEIDAIDGTVIEEL